jgi:hypothetical protein
MENKQEFSKNIEVKDGDLLSAICIALRLSTSSKAEKDWKQRYGLSESVLEEDKRDC